MSELQTDPDGESTKSMETTTKKPGRFRSSMRSVFGRSAKNRKSDETKQSKEGGISHNSRKNSAEAVAVCPVCYVVKPQSLFPDISTCEHRTCGDCLRQYMTIEINESRINLTCPECSERFHPSDIRFVLNDETLMNKYNEFTLRRTLVSDPDCRWCPAPDCGYAVIAAGCASCPKLTCEREKCKTEFCYHCKQIWHPNLTCDMARQRRASNIRSLPMTEGKGLLNGEDMKPCPRCGAFIIKLDDGTCNHMTCAVCGAEFCWLCMKEISDLHYLSPSGCTFWGKKPWSRKKKILWQMGTLIGAPLGIALAAGVVLPAMVIGIPVYVGRQMHEKYNRPYHTKKKRNIAIVSGVTLSVLVSPMLAALTVGVGVPIALGYIYGVVPISLCRSGGCASVTTLKNGRGVNLEFDSDGDMATNTNATSGGNEASSATEENLDGVVTVVATVNTRTPDGESGKQLSVSLSQECSSLASSNIEPNGKEDTGSMIPGPRSCAVSIASSIENLNINTADSHSLATSSSLTGVSPAKNDGDHVSSKASSESSLKKVVQLKVASDAVEEEKQNSKI